MPLFLVFVIDDETESAAANEIQAIDEFNDDLTSNNQLVLAAGIAGPSRASLIDNRSGNLEIKSGSLFDSNDFYSGFWIINTESNDEAEKIAARASLACNRRVELRPFLV